MVGTSLEQNGCLMEGHQILWKDWGFFSLFHIRCWLAVPIYIHGSGLDCDSHQGMNDVEGLLTSLVAAGVLRSGVTLVGSEVPCHPYHWLDHFIWDAASHQQNLLLMGIFFMWIQNCSVVLVGVNVAFETGWEGHRRTVNCQVMVSVMGSV